MKVPMVDVVGQYRSIRKEIDRELKAVLESGRFIMGPAVQEFEKEMARYLGVKHAIGCASGTDALMMALMAMEIRPGDEVITTPFTFVATAEVIALLGAKPVYVDIEPDTFLMDAGRIEKAVTKRTRAIIPVHLFGQSTDMDKINAVAKKKNLIVIEDACQAIGAEYKGRKVCGLGHMGCLSFFPSKNLGAYGDGGMVLTPDDGLAKRLRMVRDHGSERRYYHSILGVNSRLDSIQAAILHVKFKYLDRWNAARMDRAALYTELFKKSLVVTPKIKEGNTHVFHQYSIRVKNREGLQKRLEERGIASAIYYPVPLHLQEAYRSSKEKPGRFPITEEAAKDILALPMYPELKENDIRNIVRTVLEFLG